MYNLTTAIITKAAASTFLSSISGRLYNGTTENTDYPYCCIILPVSNDPQSLSSFDKDYEIVRMQFSIFSKTVSDALLIYGYLTTLYDDCTFSITGRTLIKMERINTTMIPEEHTIADRTIQARHIATDYLIATKVG